MTVLPAGAAGRAALQADLAAHLAGERRDDAPFVGAEVEFIPFDAETQRVVPLEGAPRALLPALRRFAGARRWVEARTERGTPCFHVPGGGLVGFEPGGQLEFSAAPAASASSLLHALRDTVMPMRRALADQGIELASTGIDPFNDIGAVAPQLPVERYRRMAEYFARIDDAGERMMRQTASLQLCLDGGSAMVRRWQVLQAAAPYVVAIFANSPVYAGAPTGFRSFRAEGWRRLDPARTGVIAEPDLPCAYLEFALAAPDMMRRTPDGRYLPFAAWLDAGQGTLDAWRRHLTTLFPEVRPRGYLEVRGADAVSPEWYAAPVALLAGIAYESRALDAAADLLGAPDAGLLRRAGREGLRDPALAAVAADLIAIALRGCERLGGSFLAGADLDQARAFFDRYALAGRSPADDVAEAVGAAW